MTPKLILIVDDHEDNRVVFSATLVHYGYNVLLATHGREAVEQAKLHTPDLILMDIQMPVMDGWATTRLLKVEPLTASIPIVALTAQDRTDAALQEGDFCAYVRKPVEPRHLARAVALCLNEASQEKQWIKLQPFEPARPPVR